MLKHHSHIGMRQEGKPLRPLAQQAGSVAGWGDPEAQMLELEADYAAYFGRFRDSRELSKRATASAVGLQENETASGFEANAALWRALFGMMADDRSQATPALGTAMGKGPLYVTALSFALAGNSARAQSLADDLARRCPDGTLVQFNFLPTIRAQIALKRNDASKAIDLLQSTVPYELWGLWWGFLGPVYVRGGAYLMAHQGAKAADEFQKILSHRGIVATPRGRSRASATGTSLRAVGRHEQGED